MQPAARIVAILREPASFLRSFHLQMVHRDIEKQRDFRKAIALEDERREGRQIPRDCISPEPLMYSQHVRYVEQLERYRAVFGPEQMLVLTYDEFRADNGTTLRRLLRFLDVDDTIPVPAAETKPLKAVRVQPLRRVADLARMARYDPAAAGTFGRTVHRLTPAPLRSEAFRARWRSLVFKPPDPPDEAFMRELRARFKPEVVALSEYLDRDLVARWGYDAVG
jgi:Sulfotransferase family